MNKTEEKIDMEEMISFSETRKESTENTTSGNIFCSDRILKFVSCLFFGIVSCWFSDRRKKKYSLILSSSIVVLQWFSVVGYIYCNHMFWSKKAGFKKGNLTDSAKEGSPKLPEIPKETLFMLIVLAISQAFTVTMAIHYFYSNKNRFSSKGTFNLLPEISVSDEIVDMSISKYAWLFTNILLIFGIIGVLFLLCTSLATNTMFDFHGIHAFLNHTTAGNKIIYYITVSMLFWGSGTSVCACCLFHIMSVQIIAVIRDSQRKMLSNAKSRQEFFQLHENLLEYKDKLLNKFKYWFAIHNIMYICLVGSMIFEWIAFMKHSEYQPNFLVSQVAGTILIGYKFVFPFVSASLVTVEFSKMYEIIARKNRFENIPELLLFPSRFGFVIFGLRITPSVALIAFLSSFVGFLKYIVTSN